MGADLKTGKLLSGDTYLRQSMRMTLRTPLQSLVMHRDFGSKLMELIDEPRNQKLQLKALSYAAEAVEKWLPHIKTAAATDGVFENKFSIRVVYHNADTNQNSEIDLGEIWSPIS